MNFFKPTRYEISDEENNLLLMGQQLKRQGKYLEATNVYLEILKKYGLSGIVYIALAKNLACAREFDSAIQLLKLANDSCIDQFGIEDQNAIYHMETLMNRKKMNSETFLRYMKSIAGNQNYTL